MTAGSAMSPPSTTMSNSDRASFSASVGTTEPSSSSSSSLSSSLPPIKVKLSPVEQTMLTTLKCRADDAASATPILGDAHAQRILDRVDLVSSSNSNTNSSSSSGENDGEGVSPSLLPTDPRYGHYSAVRAKRIDGWALDFLLRARTRTRARLTAEKEKGERGEEKGQKKKKQKKQSVTVLHLACGLDLRAMRVRQAFTAAAAADESRSSSKQEGKDRDTEEEEEEEEEEEDGAANTTSLNIQWIDLDRPEVAALRRRLIPESDAFGVVVTHNDNNNNKNSNSEEEEEEESDDKEIASNSRPESSSSSSEKERDGKGNPKKKEQQQQQQQEGKEKEEVEVELQDKGNDKDKDKDKTTWSYKLISASVFDRDWLETHVPRDAPLLVIAEGLFPYLEEEQALDLIGRLVDHHVSSPSSAPSSPSSFSSTRPDCAHPYVKKEQQDDNSYCDCQGEIIFDTVGSILTRFTSLMPLYKKTGIRMRWGVDDAERDVVEKLRLTQSSASGSGSRSFRFVETALFRDMLPGWFASGAPPAFGFWTPLFSLLPSWRTYGQVLRFEF